MTQPCPRYGRPCDALTAVVEPTGCFYVCDRCITFSDPDACHECGEPFNDADAPASGLCAACSGDHYDEELAAAHAEREAISDWENERGVER